MPDCKTELELILRAVYETSGVVPKSSGLYKLFSSPDPAPDEKGTWYEGIDGERIKMPIPAYGQYKLSGAVFYEDDNGEYALTTRSSVAGIVNFTYKYYIDDDSDAALYTQTRRLQVVKTQVADVDGANAWFYKVKKYDLKGVRTPRRTRPQASVVCRLLLKNSRPLTLFWLWTSGLKV